MAAPSDEQLAKLEGRLRQAVEAFVRELNGPSHVLTDVVVVAATADMADTSGATQYTVATPGTPYHGGIGLVSYADDVLRERRFGDDE